MESQDILVNPWVIKKQVLPQHTDHAGVMWHGSYLHWLEEARIEALFSSGTLYRDLSADGFEMPVVSLNIKYISPLKHGETALLKSTVLPPKGVRWTWLTKILKDDESKIAEAKIELVLVKKNKDDFRVVRQIPDHLQKTL